MKYLYLNIHMIFCLQMLSRTVKFASIILTKLRYYLSLKRDSPTNK